MVPTWTGKPGKSEKKFLVREKSENFEQTGKGNFTPNTEKNEGFLLSVYTGKMRTFNQFLFFSVAF